MYWRPYYLRMAFSAHQQWFSTVRHKHLFRYCWCICKNKQTQKTYIYLESIYSALIYITIAMCFKCFYLRISGTTFTQGHKSAWQANCYFATIKSSIPSKDIYSKNQYLKKGFSNTWQMLKMNLYNLKNVKGNNLKLY